MKFLLITMLLIIFGFFGAYDAFAQSVITCPSCVHIQENELLLYQQLFPLIIWTDNQVYDHQSVIHVHGFLRPENHISPVTVTVTNPIGNVVDVEQLTPSPDGNFEFSLNTSGSAWKKDGDYIIKANSGSSTRQFKTSVNVTSESITHAICSEKEVKVLATNGGTYCMPFTITKGNVMGIDGTLDVQSKTLTFKVKGTDIESLILDIPRAILDSKSESGSDSSFVMMSSGKIIGYEELTSTSQYRKVKLDFSSIQNAEFQIIGTKVIPEFGSVVMIILIAATAVTIILRRSFSHNLVKF